MEPRRTPPRQWQIDVSVGAAFFTIGAGGVLTLLVTNGLAANPAWHTRWFVITVCCFGLFAAIGLYMLLAVYVPFLPLPETRANAEARAQMTVGPVKAVIETPTYSVVEFATLTGWRDIDNAGMNVVVTDFCTVSRCDEDGNVGRYDNAGQAHSSESLDGFEGVESN